MILNLVIGVIEKSTQAKLVIGLHLEIDLVGVRVLSSFLFEDDLRLYWVVMNDYEIVFVECEGRDDVVESAIYR